LIRSLVPAGIVVVCGAFASIMSGCDSPSTDVLLANQYPASSGFVVFDAFWQAVSLANPECPVEPGDSSAAQSTVAASDNTAYVVIAPGYTGSCDGGAATPASQLVLQSRQGFSVHTNTTLTIPVDDTTFAGNCAAGSTLSQDQADFITTRVFAADFAGLHYDAATCTTTLAP
jgi:hypothetical protein